MKILITGVGGFIGCHLAKSLVLNKHIVYGVDDFSNYKKNKKLIKLRKKFLNKLDKKRFNFFHKDLLKQSTYTFLKKFNIDLILNLAAKPGVFEGEKNNNQYIEKNIILLNNLLRFSKEKKIKYFYSASSSSVYGGINFRDDDKKKLNPKSFYGLTKVLGENLLKFYAVNNNINILSMRFFTVYGALGRPDMIYYNFLLKEKNKKIIYLFNRGNNKRSFTFIDDLIYCIIELIKNKSKIFKNKNYECLNIGNEKYYSVNDLIKTYQKISDQYYKFKIINLDSKDIDPYMTRSNNKKLFRYIKKISFISLEDGLKVFKKWFISNY